MHTVFQVASCLRYLLIGRELLSYFLHKSQDFDSYFDASTSIAREIHRLLPGTSEAYFGRDFRRILSLETSRLHEFVAKAASNCESFFYEALP